MRADYGIDDAEIARLVGLVKSSSDAIIAEDLNGIVQGWNRGAESIYGYSAAEMVGKGMQILLPPDHLEEESTILEAIRSGECVHHFATLRVRKDGRAINVSLTVSPIRDRRGQITGASGRVKRPLFNLVISNVPGPRAPLYLGDAKLLANYPVSLIWHGYAVNITVQSYCDNLDVGIIACRNTVPRVQRMLDHLETALAELEQAGD